MNLVNTEHKASIPASALGRGRSYKSVMGSPSFLKPITLKINSLRTAVKTVKEKSLQVLETELDIVFSKFIAYRDYKNGWNCFICGKKITSKGNGETGHFIRRQHMPTRYNEFNGNFICFDCNRDDPEHEKHYRHAMIRTYGIKVVEHLEMIKNGLQKFMRFELQEMIDHYRIEGEKLKRQKGL